MGKNTRRIMHLAESVTAVISALKLAQKMAPTIAKRTRKELNALATSGLISRKEARQILRAAMQEARKEEKRMRTFIASELKRELKKAKPLVKKALAKKREQFARYRTLRRRR